MSLLANSEKISGFLIWFSSVPRNKSSLSVLAKQDLVTPLQFLLPPVNFDFYLRCFSDLSW